MKHPIRIPYAGPVLLALAVTLLAGCSSEPSPNAQTDADRLKLVQTYRGYFDQAKGDYAALPAPDKAAFVKLAGSEAKAQTVWDQMKFGPGGKPTR